MKKIILSLCLVLFVSSAYAGSCPMMAKNIDEKIKDFLLNNPEVILQSLEKFLKKKQIRPKKKKLNNKIITENKKQLLSSVNGMYSGNLKSENVIVEFFRL